MIGRSFVGFCVPLWGLVEEAEASPIVPLSLSPPPPPPCALSNKTKKLRSCSAARGGKTNGSQIVAEGYSSLPLRTFPEKLFSFALRLELDFRMASLETIKASRSSGPAAHPLPPHPTPPPLHPRLSQAYKHRPPTASSPL